MPPRVKCYQCGKLNPPISDSQKKKKLFGFRRCIDCVGRKSTWTAPAGWVPPAPPAAVPAAASGSSSADSPAAATTGDDATDAGGAEPAAASGALDDAFHSDEQEPPAEVTGPAAPTALWRPPLKAAQAQSAWWRQ